MILHLGRGTKDFVLFSSCLSKKQLLVAGRTGDGGSREIEWRGFDGEIFISKHGNTDRAQLKAYRPKEHFDLFRIARKCSLNGHKYLHKL